MLVIGDGEPERRVGFNKHEVFVDFNKIIRNFLILKKYNISTITCEIVSTKEKTNGNIGCTNILHTEKYIITRKL